MHSITSRWPHQDSIKVEWNLGKRCNYDCSYCPAEIHDNSSPHTDIEILKSAVDRLAAIGKPIRLSFTGGEPTVHPKIEELFRYCRDRVEWISVTTNGTRLPDWYHSQPVDHYVFSLHFENEWERVMLNIMRFSNLKRVDGAGTQPFTVHVMAHQEKMHDVRSAVLHLDASNIDHAIRRVRWTQGDHDLFDDMRYDQKDLDWILSKNATAQPNCLVDDREYKHANDIIKHHQNQFNGWRCNIGLESLMINWDGEVHRATCRVGGSLGNIYTGSFYVPSSSIVCTRNYCTCAADIPITKKKT
jgi:hypothetical protein